MRIYLVIVTIQGGKWPTVLKVFGTKEKAEAWLNEKKPLFRSDAEYLIEEHEVIE